MVQLAASNARQHRRFFEAIGDPEEARRSSLDERNVRIEEKAAKIAARMNGGPSIERAPARVGEHTDEVLAAAGYSAREIAALRSSGAIA